MGTQGAAARAIAGNESRFLELNYTMPKMPAFCTQCGHMFMSNLFDTGNAIGITFIDCADICPVCGGTALIPDGTYDFINETIHLIAGPTTSRAKMKRGLEALRHIQESNANEQEAMQTLRLEAPELVQAIENLQESYRWRLVRDVLIPLLIVLLTFLYQSGSQNEVPSTQEIEEALRRAIGEVLGD